MQKREIKNETQVELFKRIKKEIPPHIPLVNRIANVLDICKDSAYRRINGDYELSLEDAVKVCKHYGISLDEIIYGIGKMQYTLIPSELKGIEGNLKFAQQLLDITDNIKKSQAGEIFLTAADLPAFHFIAHKELTEFQMFSWYKNVYDIEGTYEDFTKELDVSEIMSLLGKSHQNYRQIPSTEIWTEHTIDSILKLIRYHAEMYHFSDSKSLQLLCEQILIILETLEEWIKTGAKGKENVPYKFYINEIDIGNTFIFLKDKEKSDCLIRLFTINGLNIKDEGFCNEVEMWIKSLIRRSTLISGVSAKERIKFLTGQKLKVIDLLNTA